jgi:hypothetical protein
MSKKTHRVLLTMAVHKTLRIPPDQLKETARFAQILGWKVAQVDNEVIDELCEACGQPLNDHNGFSDSEGVPLCEECWNELIGADGVTQEAK